MRKSGVHSPTPLLVEVLDEAARESCLLALPSRWKLLRPLNCQRTPPTIPASHATALPVPHRPLCSQCFFLFGSCVRSSQRLRRLRVFAGLGAELSRTESCDTDVQDALSAPEVGRPS